MGSRRIKHKSRTTFFVTAINVSAQLKDVLKEAKNISLEAMNAKALVSRGGDNVRTFKPITDYMVELSSDTIRLVELINEESAEISNSSLIAMRSEQSMLQLKSARQKSQGALYRDSFETSTQDTIAKCAQYERNLDRKTERLKDLLEEIETRMLAANVLTSTSRLEAATVSNLYRANFEAIVSKFEVAAKNIRTIVIQCRKLLNAV